MTNKPSSPIGHVASVVLAGAATVATFALFSTVSPANAQAAVASGSIAATTSAGPQSPLTGRIIAVDDDNGNSVNDQGQTSGDIFTQNAQDQSTA
ncbi:hypothetical protein ABIA30_001173 [Mycobacterium sp. MAA66]